MTAADPAPRTCLARVRGRVQGVGYREACARQAMLLGVTGWVRNRVDGTVEACLQASAARVERMCDWLRRGPPMAQVDGVELTELPPSTPRFERFERRAGE